MIAKSTTLAFVFAAVVLCYGPSAHSREIDSRAIDAESVIKAFAASCDGYSSDELLVREARKIAPKVTAPAIGKGVLALRKKRALRPELVLRVVSWEKVIETHSLAELRQKLAQDEISHHPGIYLFRSRDRYLYIGESDDLAVRLSEHVQGSDRESLAQYLAGDAADQVTVEVHAFAPDSPASKAVMRQAYESELIRSRNPRFNVRP